MPGRAEYLVYTAGSCKAGDGAPGGWGFVIKPPNAADVEGYGKAIHTLAKVMEYRAVAEALAALPKGARATVFSDNQSLVETLQKKLPVWIGNGFANVDPTIVALARAIGEHVTEKALVVEWKWIKSHNGNLGNERADALAAQGAREAKRDLAR